VSPRYFETIGLPLVAGRSFTNDDRLGTPPVALINETMARTHWRGENSIGKRVNFEAVRPGRPLAEPWMEIIGVVADARQHRLDAPPRPEIYTPLAQAPTASGSLSLLVRSATAAELAPSVRRTVQELDPRVPVFDIRTMTSIIHEATATPRYTSTLIGLFAALALTLAALGIHGLGAYAGAQRTREIGIRIALGATRTDVVRLIATQGLAPALAGLVLGSVGAIAGSRLLKSLLYEVAPSDPVVFAAALVTLLAGAVLATCLPAVRATRVDPVVALRAE
jgi:putative ABC transport system permease protein